MTENDMALEQMGEKERETIRRSLQAVCEGPFLEDWEFATGIGLSRDALALILAQWPSVDDAQDDCDVTLAVNNCLNELCYGLEVPTDEWNQWFDVTRNELIEVFQKWAQLRGWCRTGIR